MDNVKIEELKKIYPEETRPLQGRSKDLTGQKFGHLTVIYRVDRQFLKQRETYWLCECDCGNIKVHSGCRLGKEVFCCGKDCIYKKTKTKDLTGLRFNRLTVLTKSNNRSKDGHVKWICQCDCGNICEIEGRYLTSERSTSCGSCPDKVISTGNNKIRNWLEINNIKFKQEYRIDECRNIIPLPFDFAIFKDGQLYCLIEYQGTQHYFPSGGWSTKETVKKLQERDEIKKNYCQNNGIKLLIIPYTKLAIINNILEEELYYAKG